MLYEQFCKLHPVSRETFSRLETYVELLKKWQKHINLVSNNTLNDIWHRHILDGIHVVKHLDVKESDFLVDLGSGSGVPGLIVGILLDNKIELVESDQRKCAFLETVSRETSRPNITVNNTRIEHSLIHNADVVMARALAPLEKLLTLAFPIVSKTGKCLFHKGESLDSELKQADEGWRFTMEKYESITQEGSFLIELSNIEKLT